MEECARLLHFKLAVKGSAALFTRYKLRELTPAQKVQAADTTTKEELPTPHIDLEGIEHFGITMNAFGGSRAFGLCPIPVNGEAFIRPGVEWIYKNCLVAY